MLFYDFFRNIKTTQIDRISEPGREGVERVKSRKKVEIFLAITVLRHWKRRNDGESLPSIRWKIMIYEETHKVAIKARVKGIYTTTASPPLHPVLSP